MSTENITKINEPYPAVAIDNFIPSPSLLRAAAESFKTVKSEGWVSYSKESGQTQLSSRDRMYIPSPALIVLDHIARHILIQIRYLATSQKMPFRTHHIMLLA